VPVRERKILGDEGRDGERVGVGVIYKMRMLMKSNGDCVHSKNNQGLVIVHEAHYIIVNLKNILSLIKSVWKT
jgi:hypothetical protein